MHIAKLIADNPRFVSLEFYPPKDRDTWPKFFETAERLKQVDPLFVSVTYGAGGSTQDNTLEIATLLKQDLDFEPLVHLTTVGASREKIAAFLTELDKAGISNVLALRGDPPRGCEFVPDNEEFQHASDLVFFIKKEFPQFCVAAASYPSPHPQAPTVGEDLKWTVHKVACGADFLVTQLFFDHRLYQDHIARLHGMGCDVPVVPGILPIMSMKSLRFILSMCGANIPGNFYLELEQAEAEGPDSLKEKGLDFATAFCKDLMDKDGAPGVHLYTLNQAKAVMRIVEGLKG